MIEMEQSKSFIYDITNISNFHKIFFTRSIFRQFSSFSQNYKTVQDMLFKYSFWNIQILTYVFKTSPEIYFSL